MATNRIQLLWLKGRGMLLAKTTEPAASRILSAAESVNSFAAIAEPNASVDSMDPRTPTTTPGGTFVLGTPSNT
jgi:hypothetical protein